MTPARQQQPHLRPLRPADAATLAQWTTDEDFRRQAEWREGLTVEEAQAFWDAAITSPRAELVRLAAVVGEVLVGYVDLHGEEPGSRELGYLVGPSSRWGQGLGTELARLGLAHGFTAMGLERIWAEALAANEASVRILRSIGMTETGPGGVAPFLGQESRYLQFEMTREQWDGRASVRVVGWTA